MTNNDIVYTVLMGSYTSKLTANIYLSFCPAEVKDQSPHSLVSSSVLYLSATHFFQSVEPIGII